MAPLDSLCLEARNTPGLRSPDIDSIHRSAPFDGVLLLNVMWPVRDQSGPETLWSGSPTIIAMSSPLPSEARTNMPYGTPSGWERFEVKAICDPSGDHVGSNSHAG